MRTNNFCYCLCFILFVIINVKCVNLFQTPRTFDILSGTLWSNTLNTNIDTNINCPNGNSNKCLGILPRTDANSALISVSLDGSSYSNLQLIYDINTGI